MSLFFFWLAILPSILLARNVLKYDRIEREPTGLLVRLFVGGMLSCIPASIIEGMGDVVVQGISVSAGMYSALTFLLLVPLAEEGVKYFVLRRVRRNPNFNYTFDGIVYGTMVGLGFATLENLLYVFEYQTLETAIMRGILSVPLHCTCGIFMGYYFGVARGQEARGQEQEAIRARKLCMLVPCIIHGLYDYSLDVDSTVILLLGLLFTLLIFWLARKQVLIASINDEPIMATVNREVFAPLPPERTWANKGTTPPPFNN